MSVPERRPRPGGVGIRRRTLDVLGAAVGLALLVPLMAAIALVIRVGSPGPVLFRQTRLTGGRREFTILKFRTMRVAHEGPQITAVGDGRITAVGGFLRRTHLDELPQLLNVLLGEMTLVGPRPETPALAARYPSSSQWVLDHRPGLTGPTQVRPREFNDIPVDVVNTEKWYLEQLVPKRVVMDATYLDHPTLGATVGLLLQTVFQVISAATPRARADAKPRGRTAG